jgi:hypothetical protein
MINETTLMATKQLVRLVLLRERESADHGAPITVAPPAELEASLGAVSSEELLAAIRRHRLEMVLHGDSLVSELLPDLADKLKALARAETMAALALASFTREMAALFQRAGIPMLVIKGVPLSLQTTGSLTARGRGDLDLLVDPQQVGAAIDLLQKKGFSSPYGPFGVGSKTWQGHYIRWVSIEISLQRDQRSQRQWVDLHWHPSHVRGIFPRFYRLWEHRELVSINGELVATLPQSSAFVHACCHAMVDRWMCLRNLADVERLSRSFCSNPMTPNIIRLRGILKTCAVAAELTNSPQLEFIARRINPFQAKKALKLANAAQQRGWKSLGEGEWTVCNRIRDSLHQLNLSHHPTHWISMATQQLVPQHALFNEYDGQLLPAWRVLKNRARKLAWRLRVGNG